MIQAQKLSGHRGLITCADCAHVSAGLLLATGSEDKTIRLWDLRSNRTWKCISNNSIFQQEIGSILIHENYIYCSSSTSLYIFDIRNESLVIKQPSQVYKNITNDDINSIAINSNYNTLAISDDNGTISLLERFTSTGIKKLQGLHSSIAGSIAFHPFFPNELISGGFDCIMGLWDIHTRRIRCRTNFSTALGSTAGQQFLNPPFVHALSYIYNGQLMCCALGDGSIRLYGIREDVNTELRGRESVIGSVFDKPIVVKSEAHNAMISCMHSNPTSDWILTGGVDKTVKLWRVNGYQSEVVAADINPSENKSLLSDESKASSTVEGDEDEQKDDMNYLTSEVQSNLNLQSKSTTITTATAKKKYKKKNKGKSAVDNESSVSIDLIWSFNHNRKINIVKCFAPPVSVISNSVETDILPSLASGVFVIDAASSDVYIYKPAC